MRHLSKDQMAYEQLNNRLQEEYKNLYSFTDYVNKIRKLLLSNLKYSLMSLIKT